MCVRWTEEKRFQANWHVVFLVCLVHSTEHRIIWSSERSSFGGHSDGQTFNRLIGSPSNRFNFSSHGCLHNSLARWTNINLHNGIDAAFECNHKSSSGARICDCCRQMDGKVLLWNIYVDHAIIKVIRQNRVVTAFHLPTEWSTRNAWNWCRIVVESFSWRGFCGFSENLRLNFRFSDDQVSELFFKCEIRQLRM